MDSHIEYDEILTMVEAIQTTSMLIGYKYDINENKRLFKISIFKNSLNKIFIKLYKTTNLLAIEFTNNTKTAKFVLNSQDYTNDEKISFLQNILEEL